METHTKLPGAPVFGTFKQLTDALPKIYGSRDMFREIVDGQIISTSADEFKRRVQTIGAALLKSGVIDRVALIGETSVDWLAAYFGTVCGGGTTVPIDRELTARDVAAIINESGAACVIYSPAYQAMIDKASTNTPYIQKYICTGDVEQSGRFTALKILTGTATDDDIQAFRNIVTYPDDVCSLLFTSGTTGKSKGVLLTQNNLLQTARGHTELFRQDDVCMSVLPIHHTYEFTVGFLGSIMSGVTVCINGSLRYFMRNLKRFSPKNMYVVPAFVEMLYSKIRDAQNEKGRLNELNTLIESGYSGTDVQTQILGDIKELLGGRLSLMVSGGAPLPAFYVDAFKNMGVTILQGYGTTECSPLVSINPEWDNVPGSVGKVISCCDVKIINPDKNGNGEIAVKGANIMKGYYNNPKATDQYIKDGRFYTGDIGYIDDDGNLFITGRKKNIIVLPNGKNIYPEEIEGYFSRIPYIKEIIIHGITDKNGVETQLIAEIYADDKVRAAMAPADFNAKLEADMAKINRELPFFKQVHKFKLRDTEFEKTTKKSIKR